MVDLKTVCTRHVDDGAGFWLTHFAIELTTRTIMTQRYETFRKTVATGAVAGALILSGCAGDGPTASSEGGEGVPAGAEPAEFIEALVDMEPVTLTYQSSSGSAVSEDAAKDVELKEYIEEYSGGKITVEIAWGNSIVPPTEMARAMEDGRLDFGSVLPYYTPSEFPVSTMLSELTVFADEGYVDSTLGIVGSLSEYIAQEPAYREEFLEAGLHVVSTNGVNPYILMCREDVITSLEDFEGLQVRVPNEVHKNLVEHLGAVAVSVPYNETYEALQRGIIDCTTSAFTTADIAGYTEVAPWVYYAPEIPLPPSAGILVYNDRVAGLPVPAQQIVFDALVRSAGALILDDLRAVQASLATIGDLGALSTLDADTVSALAEARAEQQDSAGNDVAEISDPPSAVIPPIVEKWAAAIDAAGLSDEGGLADFDDWYSADGFDIEPWLDMMAEALAPIRPGAQ